MIYFLCECKFEGKGILIGAGRTGASDNGAAIFLICSSSLSEEEEESSSVFFFLFEEISLGIIFIDAIACRVLRDGGPSGDRITELPDGLILPPALGRR